MQLATMATLFMRLSAAAASASFPVPAGKVWQPVLGDWSKPVLTADPTTWEHTAVQEPQVIGMPEKGNASMRMWYRGAGWGPPSGLGVADSTE